MALSPHLWRGKLGLSGIPWRVRSGSGANAPARAGADAMRLFRGEVARATGLEPATSGVTGRHSNRLSYARA